MDRSIRNRHAALAATLAFVVAACATAAPRRRRGRRPHLPRQRRPHRRDGGARPRRNPAIKWQFDAGGPFANSPVVGGGVVFAASGEGAVHALDLATGSQRWSVDVGSRVSASPLLVGRLVILADEDGAVHAISAADGSQAWTAETDGPITGSPAAVGDDIVVATTGTHAYRLDAPTGNQVWSVDIGGATTRSVTVDDDTAYLGLEGDIVAIALSDGRERWRATIAASGNVGTPTIVGDLVYAATGIDGEPADSGVAAIDAASGEVRWRYTSPTQATVYTPAVVGGRAFVLGHDGLLVALDPQTGNGLWTHDFGVDLEALPSIVGDTVYVVGNDGPAAAVTSPRGTFGGRSRSRGCPSRRRSSTDTSWSARASATCTRSAVRDARAVICRQPMASARASPVRASARDGGM